MESYNVFVKETTTTAVYKHLKNLILTGYFRPGEWIRERKIKEMLDVSSTPIREALRMLVQERILISVPHRGVRLKTFSQKELRDFYELRSELEGLAAELAAVRCTKKQLWAIEDILAVTEVELKEDSNFASEAINYNNQFHDLLASASGNEALMHSLSQMRTEVNLLRVMSWKSENKRPIITLKQHELIFEAVKQKNPKLARQQISNHIWDSAKLVMGVARDFQGEDND
jgi:DNA-binding GntR family transcriptional regulator